MILWYIVSIGGADAVLGIGAVVIALGALGDGKAGLLASTAVGQSIKFVFESIGPQVGTCDGILMEFIFGEYFQTINVCLTRINWCKIG